MGPVAESASFRSCETPALLIRISMRRGLSPKCFLEASIIMSLAAWASVRSARTVLHWTPNDSVKDAANSSVLVRDDSDV